MTTGLHHVTSIAADVQANVDFYAGFLGLRLVKRAGGFEDGEQLHLFYGDAAGSPGSLLTFLIWPAAGRGRTGAGQASEISLSVPPEAIGDWLIRAMRAGVPVEGPTREFGETVLRLKDPDGLIVKLVGAGLPVAAPWRDAPARLRGVTLLVEETEPTAALLTRFGYRDIGREGAARRMASDADIVDLRAVSGYVPSVEGAGVPNHVAFRAPSEEAVRDTFAALRDAGPMNMHDRRYFFSLYVMSPGAGLFELASDGPGMAVDEDPAHLGETLMIPPLDADRAEDLRVMLPQFALPGEERMPRRDLPFAHRFHTPGNPDGRVLVLLHGAGATEGDLMPFAHRIAPNATLLGVRGRAMEEGTPRWFRRDGLLGSDQADVASEARAFAAFADMAAQAYGLDPARMTFVGYSNGASFLAAAMRLYPDLAPRAILLRAGEALAVQPGLSRGGAALMLNGKWDLLDTTANALEAALAASGVAVEREVIEASHDLTAADEAAARAWLDRALPA